MEYFEKIIIAKEIAIALPKKTILPSPFYVGGEDEYLTYTTGDESKGYAEGNRVGLKVTAPDVELDLDNAVLEMNLTKNLWLVNQFLKGN